MPSGQKAQVVPILLLEDDATSRSLVLAALAQDPLYAPSEATTVAGARALIEESEEGFGAALVDLHLPDGTGEAVIDALMRKNPSTIAIVLSGDRSEEAVVNCLARGAIDFLSKPAMPQEILDTLAQALKRQGKIVAEEGGIEAESPTGGWVELTARSEMEYLKRMQRFTQILFDAHLPQGVQDDLRAVIEEAGRNAIEWGNKFDREKRFRISYCRFSDRIILKFEDEGEGFRPDGEYDPTRDPVGHIKKRKADGKRPGGFGLYMLRQMMDEVVFNEKGNVVLMTKLLEQPEAGTEGQSAASEA
jgi:DNA-binding response OmpR family regulator